MSNKFDLLLFKITLNYLLIPNVSCFKERLCKILLFLGQCFVELIQSLDLLKHNCCRRTDAIAYLIICQINNSGGSRLGTIFSSIRTLGISALDIFSFSFCLKFAHLI